MTLDFEQDIQTAAVSCSIATAKSSSWLSVDVIARAKLA